MDYIVASDEQREVKLPANGSSNCSETQLLEKKLRFQIDT